MPPSTANAPAAQPGDVATHNKPGETGPAMFTDAELGIGLNATGLGASPAEASNKLPSWITDTPICTLKTKKSEEDDADNQINVEFVNAEQMRQILAAWEKEGEEIRKQQQTKEGKQSSIDAVKAGKGNSVVAHSDNGPPAKQDVDRLRDAAQKTFEQTATNITNEAKAQETAKVAAEAATATQSQTMTLQPK